MKTRLTLLLAALVLLLPACGGTPTPAGDGTPSPAPASTAAPTSAPEGGGRPDGGKPSMSVAGTITETVLLEQDGIKITATGLEYADSAAKLSVLLENDSGQDLSFRSGTMGYACNSVNGYMSSDGYVNADVPTGKKANVTLTFGFEELYILGITELANIEVGFDIVDSSYDTYLQTGPLPLRTSLAESYDGSVSTYREAVSGGLLSSLYRFTLDYWAEDVAFDQCGVRVTSLALMTNEDGETALFLEVENTSDEPVLAAARNFYLNGLLVEDSAWSRERINAGKRRVMTVPLSRLVEDSYRDMLGLTELGSLAFSVELKDADGQELAAPEELSITLPEGPASFNGEGAVLYEGEGVRVVLKDLVPDASSYSEDIHVLLLAENSGTAPVLVEAEGSSVSVNGFMTDAWGTSGTVAPGRCVLLDLSLQEEALEDNRIDGVAEIENIELTLRLWDTSGHVIAEPVLTYTAAS